MSVGASDDPVWRRLATRADAVRPQPLNGDAAGPHEPAAGPIADRLTRAPAQQLQRSCACGGSCPKCSGGAREDEGVRVQTKRDGGGGAAAQAEAPPAVGEALRSPGAPLDTATRGFMEQRLGYDFGGVRVHSGARAAESARAVGALAYTVGSDVVMGAGAYAPGTSEGLRLIAHELAHVVQQGGQSRAVQGRLEVTDAADPSEVEAERASEAVMRGSTFSLTHGLASTLSRAPDPVVRIAISGGSVTFFTQSGEEYSGTVTTDLVPGTYYLSPQKGVKKWVITGDVVPPGLRFDVTLQGADPWALGYAKRTVLEVGAGPAEPEPEPAGMSVDDRVARIGSLIQENWTGGSEEEEILKLIAETPEADAAALLKRLTDEKVNGESYLDALDRAVDLGNNLTLHEALSQLRMKAMGAEKGAEALANAPVLPWHDVMGFFEDAATFTAEKQPNGKIRIRYLGGTRLLRSTDFGSEIKHLPFNIFIGGQDYDPNQVLIIHDYDSGRNVPVTASELAGYQHLGVRNFLTHVATVASFATPMGAARSAAGKAAVIVVERVLPAAILLVDENRLNIVKWFPNWGPKMIRYSDMAKVGIAVYGIARFAITGWQVFKQWKEVRNARKALDAGAAVDAEAERVAAALERNADQIISEAEKIRAAEAAVEAAPDSAAAASKADEAASAVAGADDAKGVAGAAGETPAAVTPAQQAGTPAPRARGDVFEGISEETKKMLDANPELKSALQQNPRAADALKLCRSDCFPRFATKEQIARLDKMLAEAEEFGIPVNRTKLKEFLHQQQNRKELDSALELLEDKFLDQKARLGSARAAEIRADVEEAGSVVPDPTIEAPPPPTPQLRGAQGVASGGETLPVIKGRWFPDGRVGRFPKQIADKMRGMHFKNFDEFRETFWKLVARDKDLSKGWKPDQIQQMLAGSPPGAPSAQRVGGGSNAVYQLNHIQAIEHGGPVLDMDNIEIVTPVFHQGIGQ